MGNSDSVGEEGGEVKEESECGKYMGLNRGHMGWTCGPICVCASRKKNHFAQHQKIFRSGSGHLEFEKPVQNILTSG